MTSCLRQETHRSAKQQREYHQHTYCPQKVPITHDPFACRGSGAVRGRTRKLKHCDDGNNEQREYNDCDEDIDNLVNTRFAVQANVYI